MYISSFPYRSKILWASVFGIAQKVQNSLLEQLTALGGRIPSDSHNSIQDKEGLPDIEGF